MNLNSLEQHNGDAFVTESSNPKLRKNVFRMGIFGVMVILCLIALAACSKTETNFTSALAKQVGNQPRFSSTSNEPVLLRYKFKPGETREGHYEIIFNVTSSRGNRSQQIKMLLDLRARYKVKAVNADGDATVDLSYSRIIVRSMGPRQVDYDSNRDKASKKAQFAAYNSLLDTPMELTIDPRGKIKSVDVSALEKKINALGNKAMASHFKQTSQEITHSAFVALPKDPVKTGDLINVGSLSSPLPNVGKMTMKTQYKVLAVSGDKKRVLLQPITKYSIQAVKNAPFKSRIHDMKLAAWVLFDREIGNVIKSAAKVKLRQISDIQGTKVIIDSLSEVRFVNKIH